MKISFTNNGIRYVFEHNVSTQEPAICKPGWTAWKHKCPSCGQPTNLQGLCKGCRP